MAYLGGRPRSDAPLWPDHEHFLQATLYEKVLFLLFSSKNCKIQQCLMVFCVSKFQKNGRICGFHWTLRSKKCFSFRGAKPPWLLTRGSAPGRRLYRLYLKASVRLWVADKTIFRSDCRPIHAVVTLLYRTIKSTLKYDSVIRRTWATAAASNLPFTIAAKQLQIDTVIVASL